MKNRIIKLSMILLVGIIAMTGCKKGANDPLISLLSRDARITGIWKLVKQELTQITAYSADGTVVTQTVTRNYDGSLMTIASAGGTNSYSYSNEMTIDKDGTYDTKTVQENTVNDMNGYWWWLDDTKDKTRIAFDDDVNSFYIDQLKNDEMIFVMDTHSKTVEPNGDYSETTVTLKQTFEKQ